MEVTTSLFSPKMAFTLLRAPTQNNVALGSFGLFSTLNTTTNCLLLFSVSKELVTNIWTDRRRPVPHTASCVRQNQTLVVLAMMMMMRRRRRRSSSCSSSRLADPSLNEEDAALRSRLPAARRQLDRSQPTVSRRPDVPAAASAPVRRRGGRGPGATVVR